MLKRVPAAAPITHHTQETPGMERLLPMWLTQVIDPRIRFAPKPLQSVKFINSRCPGSSSPPSQVLCKLPLPLKPLSDILERGCKQQPVTFYCLACLLSYPLTLP